MLKSKVLTIKTDKRPNHPATLLQDLLQQTLNGLIYLSDRGSKCYLDEQVLRSILSFWSICCFLCEIKCKMRFEMYIFLNPPVTMLLSIVKMASEVAPVNGACLEDGRGSACMGTCNQNQTSKQTGSVRGPNAGQQQSQCSLWRKPSNMGIFPMGPIWDVPDGLLLPCWRQSLSKCKSLIPLQKYLSYEILPSEQPNGEFLGEKLTGSLWDLDTV